MPAETTSRVLVANICRVAISDELMRRAAEYREGIMPIPEELLPPRQIKCRPRVGVAIPATLRHHRDTYVPTISRLVATSLVSDGDATYMPQSLLIYTRKQYLQDNDVKADQEEFDRVAVSDAEFIIVGVIGESRSPVSVCRNIASGCQVMATLVDDAAAAVQDSNVFLIEG